MKITFDLTEMSIRLRELRPAEEGMTHEPSPKARMVLSFDDEIAVELTDANWTVYPPFARLKEADEFLRDSERAAAILQRFAKSGALPSRLMIGMDEDDMDLMAKLRDR